MFNPQQLKTFKKDFDKRWGDSFRHFGPDIQQAMIDSYVLNIVRGQVNDMTVAEIDYLSVSFRIMFAGKNELLDKSNS